MDIQDKAFKEWFTQYDNNIEYASEKIAWDAWKEAKAQAVLEGYVLASKEPYAYLIKHKLWQKDSDPEIFLAVDFLGDDGIERDKLTVCMPLYLGDDEAQEPTND